MDEIRRSLEIVYEIEIFSHLQSYVMDWRGKLSNFLIINCNTPEKFMLSQVHFYNIYNQSHKNRNGREHSQIEIPIFNLSVSFGSKNVIKAVRLESRWQWQAVSLTWLLPADTQNNSSCFLAAVCSLQSGGRWEMLMSRARVSPGWRERAVCVGRQCGEY